MPNGPFAVERSVAELAVVRAVQLVKHDQGRNAQDIPNRNGNPVATSSFVSQALIVAAIKEMFPNDRFVCQEDSSLLRTNPAINKFVYKRTSSIKMEGMVPGKFMDAPKSPEELHELLDRGKGGTERTGRFWVVDPIDGTFSYLVGEQWAIAVCLVVDGVEVVSAVACPNLKIVNGRISETNVDVHGMGLLFSAEKGFGAGMRTLDTLSAILPTRKKLNPVAASADPKHPVIVASTYSHILQLDVTEETADRLSIQYPNINIWSSHVRYIALVIGGGDFFLRVPLQQGYKPYIWDHAGSHLIFTELGGIVTDLDGKRLDFSCGRYLAKNRGMVAARAEVFDRVFHAVKRTIAEATRPHRGESYYVPYNDPMDRNPLVNNYGKKEKPKPPAETPMERIVRLAKETEHSIPGLPMGASRFTPEQRAALEPTLFGAAGDGDVYDDESDEEEDEDESISRASTETVRPSPSIYGEPTIELRDGATGSHETSDKTMPTTTGDSVITDKATNNDGASTKATEDKTGDNKRVTGESKDDNATASEVMKSQGNVGEADSHDEAVKRTESDEPSTADGPVASQVPIKKVELGDASSSADVSTPDKAPEQKEPQVDNQDDVTALISEAEATNAPTIAKVKIPIHAKSDDPAAENEPAVAEKIVQPEVKITGDQHEAKNKAPEAPEQDTPLVKSTHDATNTSNPAKAGERVDAAQTASADDAGVVAEVVEATETTDTDDTTKAKVDEST
ncbi:hypothetical protein VHEMI10589 [[Torrubiella] hemipterigena]|uniref:Uncharacterized protein n=1 Tax=[Torrubiella] hemipterigena TaxID=1531966 RepID=A0A0A1TDH1_9HYPO|nr:hypothetical protein VHEMI10589 [[Torrubiella] hemipterigena]